MDENQVRTTYISSLLFSGKQELVRETLTLMPKQERADCCQQLIFLIEGTLNSYVKKYIKLALSFYSSILFTNVC